METRRSVTELHVSFLLVRYPHVLRNLRAEIASSCHGSADLNRADLRNMKYLQNVLKESKLFLLSICKDATKPMQLFDSILPSL